MLRYVGANATGSLSVNVMDDDDDDDDGGGVQEKLFGAISKILSIQLSRNAFVNFPIVDPTHLKRINVSESQTLPTYAPPRPPHIIPYQS